MEPQHSSESARASNTFNLEQLKLDLKSFPKPNLKSVQADSGFLDVHDPAIPPQVPEKDRDLSLLPDTSFIEGPSVIRDDSYDMSAAPVQAMSSKEKFRSNPVAALEYARSRNAEKYQKDITLATADPSTVRKCAIADYFFLDHYYDSLHYLHHRKLRLATFKEECDTKNWTSALKESEWKLHCAKESAYLRSRRCKTGARQFQILAQIGQGGYGQVFLVRKKDSMEVCALKKMSKKLLLKMNEIQHILTERDVLTQTKTPWLVKLMYAFQDIEHVYLAMEYVPGGDMRTLLNNSGILRENDAKFYVSEMFMAVTELHKLGYIHRDLKPENFLIDTGGHVKLTDFGLSKGQISASRIDSLRGKLNQIKDMQVNHYSSLERRSFRYSSFAEHAHEESTRGFTLVGSPDYMAPEILTDSHHNAKANIMASGYDYLVDYWSLGCMLFEIMCGYPPFAAPTLEEVWVNVYHWQEVLERPIYEGADEEFNLSDDLWDLINRLVTHRHTRLASLAQVQSHPWFSDLNTTLVSAVTIADKLKFKQSTEPIWALHRSLDPSPFPPPFIPALTNEMDHSNFDDFTDPRGMEIYKEVYEKQQRLNNGASADVTEGRPNRGDFVGFTYRHKEAVGWRGVAAEVHRRAEVLEAGRSGNNLREYLRRF